MSTRNILFSLFVVVAAAQIYVPGSIIVRHEKILAEGKPFKFRTRPVDPYDAFRGRYVALGFEDATTVTLKHAHYDQGETVYVTLETKPDGFAKFASVSRTRPAEGDYIKTKMGWTYNYDKNDYAYVDAPFNRFYMEEFAAPDAETAYREHSGRENHDAYAVVRVLNGGSVIEDLFVGEKPIREYVKGVQNQKKEKKEKKK